MTASPDAMQQYLASIGLMNDPSPAPQTGLLGAISQALAPYGGLNQVALSLGSNASGASNPIAAITQGLQNSQQTAMQNQAQKLQLAQQALSMPALLYKAHLMKIMQGNTSGAPAAPGTPVGQPPGGAPPSTDQPPIGPQQGGPAIQEGQTSGVPVPQERQPAQQPTAFDVPQGTYADLPVNGLSPQQAIAAEQFLGKDVDPITATQKVREAQIRLAQQKVGQQVSTLDSVIQSQNPTNVVSANPQLMQLWRATAGNIGADPSDPTSFTPGNVRQALGLQRNALAGYGQLPRADIKPELNTSTLPDGRTVQTDPITGKEDILPASELQSVIGPDGNSKLVPKAKAAGLQPYNQVTYGAAQMAGGPADLLAALAAKGVSLPGSGRNQTQTAATLNALMRNNPDKSPDQIADMVRMGQLDFNGAKRSTAQIATLAAATDIQSNQIVKNFDSLAPLVQKNGIPVVNGWINSLQRNLTPSGDKDATAAQGYLLALAGEYAKLRSGSTGAAAPAEGEMRTSLDYIKNALTQGGFDGARTAIVQEAQNKRASVREGLQSASAVGTSVGNGPISPAAPAGAPQEGATATSKSGKPMVFKTGHWQYQ